MYKNLSNFLEYLNNRRQDYKKEMKKQDIVENFLNDRISGVIDENGVRNYKNNKLENIIIFLIELISIISSIFVILKLLKIMMVK